MNNQPKHDIFISYCRKDIEAVKAFKQEIEATTLATCWMDLDGIESGNPKFTKIIINAINSCPIFLFMLTEASQQSENALKELDFAYKKHREEGKKVAIVYIEPCKMNDEFSFDYGKADTIDWQNSLQKEKLIRDLKKWTNYAERMASKKQEEDEKIKQVQEKINALEKEGALLYAQQKRVFDEIVTQNKIIGKSEQTCPVCQESTDISNTFSPQCGWAYIPFQSAKMDEKRLVVAKKVWEQKISMPKTSAAEEKKGVIDKKQEVEDKKLIPSNYYKGILERYHTKSVTSASFSPDGRRIVSASLDKTIRIWNAETGGCLRKLSGHTSGVRQASFSPDSRHIASASLDHTIRIWDAQTGACINTLKGHASVVESVSFSPDGNRIISTSWDKTIRIWNAETGDCLAILKGHTYWGYSVCFSSNGNHIASASADKTIRLWNAQTGACINTLKRHTDGVLSVCFSPDNRCIVSASLDKTIRIWDVQTGACINTLKGHTDGVLSVCYSPDGRRIASSSNDRTVRIWDVTTGNCLKTFYGSWNNGYSANFSPDSKCIISASEDGSPRICDISDL